MRKQEYLPVNEYMAAVDVVSPLLRTQHQHPERTGLPTNMDDLELGLAAHYADDPNSMKPHVAARLERQIAQVDALESYRPNFIASVELDRDEVLNQIDERKVEIKRNTPYFRRMGKNFMTAISYIPGIDTVVAIHQENVKSKQLHIERNKERLLINPTGTKAEKSNEVFSQKFGGSGSYEKKYNKALKQHRKHESNKQIFELESEILDLQSQLKAMRVDIHELKEGRSL